MHVEVFEDEYQGKTRMKVREWTPVYGPEIPADTGGLATAAADDGGGFAEAAGLDDRRCSGSDGRRGRVEAVDTTGVELEPVSDRTLFGVSDPVEVIGEIKRIADDAEGRAGGGRHGQPHRRPRARAGRGLADARVDDRDHPRVAWSRPLENGWEARAEARTLDGRVVGAAEAMCTRSERNWASRDDFAIRAMAQTRATSRALRGPLGFVMTLAGHSPTAAEEIDAEAAEPAQLPDWALPGNIKAVGVALVATLVAAGVEEPTRIASGIGQRCYEHCGDQIPEAVLAVLQDLAGTIAANTPGAGEEPGR